MASSLTRSNSKVLVINALWSTCGSLSSLQTYLSMLIIVEYLLWLIFRISKVLAIIIIPIIIRYLCTFRSSEMWFDDVDPEDLEEVTGKRIKTSNELEPSDVLFTGKFEGFV